MAGSDLTAQRLRELLDYDAEAGLFTRKVWRGGTSRVGSVTGNKANCTLGYCQISVDGRLYFAHRLAWLYVHGDWPKHNIDHINGVRNDNRIANLRDVDQRTNIENQRRRRRDNSSGVMGVYEHKPGQYAASIRTGGKTKHLGLYASPEEAGEAYLSAKRALHNGCTI